MSAWPRRRLRDIGTWYGGGTPNKGRTDFWTDGTVPWLSPKDMGPEVLRATQDHITPRALKESAAKLVPAGSVAIVVRSGILERLLPVAVVPFQTALNQDMKALVPSDEIDPRWIAWGLRAFERQVLDTCRKAGTTVASIEMPRLYNFELPVPPLDEQRRIIDIVEDHLSRLDEANALLRHCKLRMSNWRRAIVDSAFWDRPGDERDRQTESPVDDLAQVRLSLWTKQRPDKRYKAPVEADAEMMPADLPWPVVSMEAATNPVRTIRYGILKPRVSGDACVKYVEVKDLSGNSLEGKTLRLTSRELDEQFSGSRLYPGDVVIAVRGSYERTAVVPSSLEGANMSRDVARLAPLPAYDPTFLHHWLQTSKSKAYLHRHARGVAVKGVNIETLRAMPVPVLDRETQSQVVALIDAKLAVADRTESQIELALTRVQLLRRAVLTTAFSGRLAGRARDLDFVEEMARV